MKQLLYASTIGLLISWQNAAGQNDRAKAVSLDVAAPAVQQLKSSYFGTDYYGGAVEGDKLLAQYPASRALAAWRVANLVRSGRPREAQAAAKALMTANPNDPWGWFAQTIVAEFSTDGSAPGAVLKSSLEAYRRAPDHPDMIWLRAMALSGNREPAQALALIDSVASRGPLPQELLVLKANATFGLATSTRKRDDAMVDSAFALYARARANDPQDVAAHVFAASRMMNAGHLTDVYELTKRATEIAPLSLVAHENYWRAIDELKRGSQAQRDSEVLGDVEALVRRRGDDATVLTSAAAQFAQRKLPERARALEDRILAEHPNSYTAEWTYVSRYRTLRTLQLDTTHHDSTLTPRYTRALWSFVELPVHNSDRMLGDAYRELFRLSDSTTNADTLLRIVRGMVKYEGINPHVVYADGAIRLAERGRDFKEAEQIARQGIKEGKAKIDLQKASYETVGDYAKAVDWMSAFMYNALGIIYLRQNRLVDAEKQFTHARELDPQSVRAFYQLGVMAEKRGRQAEAEQLYMKGSLLSTMGPNPNKDALKAAYRKRTGSLDGYENYLGSIEEIDRGNRKSEVAKSRAKTAVPMKAFQLTTLDGKVVTLDSLRGKAAVINAWGMWCGPCVAEMPELQKLATQYASDTAVTILTIDNDANTDALRSWMQKKGYTFPTLLDDGYLMRVNMHSFPTTWFLDRQGRVAFTKTGWSEKLVEEFGWRIEMVKAP
ncbi:MAG: redoxin domain-containing protein [Gemmatimonadota bacterium]